MKLLEELEREQTRRAATLRRPGGNPMQPEPVQEAVRRSIEMLHCRLSELADGLQQLEADARVDYEIVSVGVLRDLRQQRYSVITTESTQPRFAFCFECVGRGDLTAIVSTRARREAVLAQLSAFDLNFGVDGSSACRYAITVKPVVSVSLLFAATPDGAAIRLTAHNLNRLGRELYSIRPAQVSEEFVEELGKLILRRENRFSELTGNQISTQDRARLRERLKSREGRSGAVEDSTSADPGTAEARGSCAASQGHPQRVPRSPRHAPILVRDTTRTEGLVAWNGSAAPPRRDEGVFELAPYAWVITIDAFNPDPSESIATRGPRGTAQAYPTPKIVDSGQAFRLFGTDGALRYQGTILGTYQGSEPLREFGQGHGCCTIAYLRDGQWVPMPRKA